MHKARTRRTLRSNRVQLIYLTSPLASAFYQNRSASSWDSIEGTPPTSDPSGTHEKFISCSRGLAEPKDGRATGRYRKLDVFPRGDTFAIRDVTGFRIHAMDEVISFFVL